jgi:hypothetical protein
VCGVTCSITVLPVQIQKNSIQKKLSQGSNESMHVSENDDLIPLRFLSDYESDTEEFLKLILLEYDFLNATIADNVSRHHEIHQDCWVQDNERVQSATNGHGYITRADAHGHQRCDITATPKGQKPDTVTLLPVTVYCVRCSRVLTVLTVNLTVLQNSNNRFNRVAE